MPSGSWHEKLNTIYFHSSVLLDTKLAFFSLSLRQTFHLFHVFLVIAVTQLGWGHRWAQPGWLCVGWTQRTNCFHLTHSNGVQSGVLSGTETCSTSAFEGKLTQSWLCYLRCSYSCMLLYVPVQSSMMLDNCGFYSIL